MYGIQDKINQILRGAETIRKNQSMPTIQSDSIEPHRAICKATNEVARLREELNFIPTEQAFRDVCARADNAQTELLKTQKELTAYKRMVDSLREQNSRLAKAALNTTPEEPTTEESSEVEPAPDWRCLLPDEVIQEGDEVQPKHHVGGEWIKAWSYEIGVRSGVFNAMRYRTRRPLPVQEEMPLEDELSRIEKGRVVQDFGNGITATEKPHPDTITLISCIRYLRDEIQKLKEAR